MLLTEAFVLQAQKKRHCFRQLLEPIWARRAVLTIPKLGRQVSQTVPFVLQWSSMHAWFHIHALTLSADVNCMYYVIKLYTGCGWFDSVTSCISLSTRSELFKGYRNQLDCKGILDWQGDWWLWRNATTEDTSLTTGSDVESTACRALIWPRRPHLESSLLGLQQVWRRMTAKPCFHCMILGRVYAPACQQFHDILIYIYL